MYVRMWVDKVFGSSEWTYISKYTCIAEHNVQNIEINFWTTYGA